MRITSAWLRIDLRRRYRSLVVLALLIAVATGTVLTAVAGAHRGVTAAQRLYDRTLPATTAVLLNQPGFDWAPVRSLPEVEALTGFVIGPFLVDELPGYEGNLPPADAGAMHTIERPVVLEGRLPDPARLDEVAVTAQFPETYGKVVGDTVTLHLMSPEQAGDVDFYANPTALQGPRIPARIVGVVRSPWFVDRPGSGGSILPTAALFQRYPENLVGPGQKVGFVNALVRLHGGAAALPTFRRHLTELTGRADVELWDTTAILGEEQEIDRFESAYLLGFGIAALAAAVLLVGQAISRYVAASVSDLSVLRALGMRRREGVLTAVAGPVLAALAGSTLGVAAAAVASRWMPIGRAAYSEPAPGMDFDPLVLGIGWPVVVALVAAGAASAAWLALSERRAGRPGRRSGVVTATARAGLPVPVWVGARFALEPGRGPTAIPVRPALVGAVVGVLGVLASMTFAAGSSDAASTPERFGQTFDLILHLGDRGEDWAPVDATLAAIADDPDVVAVDDARIAVAESGSTSITLYTHAAVGGRALPVVLVSGRLPATATEVALAPTTAEALGATVGSTVPLRGTRSGDATVTGIGFVPEGAHNEYDEGGWLTPAGHDRLFDDFKYHNALVALRPGADLAAAHARLQAAATEVGHGMPAVVQDAFPPGHVRVIRDVRVLPLALGAFLALLAVGAVGHALATAVRRRRRDMAVLRALGMTRWQTRGVVVTQATVLALVGVLFGVPLGVAVGRTAWRTVADTTPLYYVPPLAFWALLLTLPVALLVANALAAWPGRLAARLRIAHVLRAE